MPSLTMLVHVGHECGPQHEVFFCVCRYGDAARAEGDTKVEEAKQAAVQAEEVCISYTTSSRSSVQTFFAFTAFNY